MLAENADQMPREIIEAKYNNSRGDNSMSCPSVSLSKRKKKAFSFLIANSDMWLCWVVLFTLYFSLHVLQQFKSCTNHYLLVVSCLHLSVVLCVKLLMLCTWKITAVLLMPLFYCYSVASRLKLLVFSRHFGHGPCSIFCVSCLYAWTFGGNIGLNVCFIIIVYLATLHAVSSTGTNVFFFNR